MAPSQQLPRCYDPTSQTIHFCEPWYLAKPPAPENDFWLNVLAVSVTMPTLVIALAALVLILFSKPLTGEDQQ